VDLSGNQVASLDGAEEPEQQCRDDDPREYPAPDVTSETCDGRIDHGKTSMTESALDDPQVSRQRREGGVGLGLALDGRQVGVALLALSFLGRC
jgi:hypothetical protein